MTTSALGIVIIVIVIAAALVVWISTVFRADKHPETGPRRSPPAQDHRRDLPRRPRQQMPRRDAPAEVMGKDREPGARDGGTPCLQGMDLGMRHGPLPLGPGHREGAV